MAAKRKVLVWVRPDGRAERYEGEHRSLQLEYKETRMKYEGFRACGYNIGMGYTGLVPHYCNDENPCCDLVLLYAKMGIHCYNLLHGKELQLIRVKKYNKSVGGGCVISSYYMTCESKDPAATRGSVRTFQAVVCEDSYNRFYLTCSVARLVGNGNGEKHKKTVRGYGALTSLMPKLPAEDPFKEDDTITSRFYVFKESELQEKDWIRLYLELAVATSNRQSAKIHSLTNLKILKAAMEITGDPNGAIIYIRYEDSCEARVGKDVDRIALVRRIFDKDNESLILVGCNQSFIASAPLEAGSSSSQD
ncbi:unnamed protein product [Microthlaspi erraticum]|uniref:Uncharacterized protein n=1 Tax=Microthlaspi erraticum TaxID=1685480 RepID=A0A6D2JKI1_9BRAS|nr:unnamed protein product [Microthlaspi erraticum]